MPTRDLLAPPKLPVRKYAKFVGAFTLALVALTTILALCGVFTPGELAARAGAMVALSAAAIGLYAILMRSAQRARPERMPVIHATLAAVTMPVILCEVSFAIPLLGEALRANWWQVPFIFGGTLAAGGWARRVGDSLHCPACEYEYTFADADAPIRCPECGTPWLGRLKRGRRILSRRLIAAGAAIVLAGLLIGNPIFYMGVLAPHLPTPLLYASLYVSPKSMYSSWDELATRPLNAASTEAMAARVLRFRASDQYDSGPSKWLESVIASPGAGAPVPTALADRFYHDAFRAELIAPSHVKAGEPFTVQLRVNHVAADGRTNIGLMFGGYTLGDDPAPRGRLDKTVWAYELRPDVFARRRDAFEQTLTADHPGEVRVRVEYWIAHLPSFMEELHWRPDGTAKKPATATWFERVEMEKTVRVE